MFYKINNIYYKYIFYIICFILILCYSIKIEYIIPNTPKKIYPINDYTNILTKEEIYFLNKKIIKYENITSIEIVVIIINSLFGDDPSLIGANWGQKWKIGKKIKSNGLILLISLKDKKISIQTGYGLEPYLTDLKCKKIINNIIKPNLIKRNYFLAIHQGTNEIFNLLKKHYYNKYKINNYKNKYIYNYLFIIICIIFYFFHKKKIMHSMAQKDIYQVPNFDYLDYHTYNNIESNSNTDKEEFDSFGNGGHFGGGGAQDNW